MIKDIGHIYDSETVICPLTHINNSAILESIENVNTAFISCTINASICTWLLGIGVTQFLSDSRPRRLHKSWKIVGKELRHWDYGGVTNCTHNFTFCSQSSIIIQNDLNELRHSRDAHTILDDKVWCKNKRRRPEPKEVHPLRVLNVGSDKSHIYHIGGLLPICNLLNCSIIAPAIGCSKDVWGIRKLTKREILDSLDVSDTMTSQLMDRTILFQTKTIPAGLWIVAISAFVRFIGGQHDSLEESVSQKQKLCSNSSLVDLGHHHSDLLNSLSEGKIDQGAVKSDDANVDYSMWLDYFLDGGGFSSISVEFRCSIQHSMDTFRCWMLSWWKRKLLREYCNYLEVSFPVWKSFRANYLKRLVSLDISTGTYAWLSGGLLRYREGWKRRIILSRSEWMKGSDSLIRALRSSWWEWSDGSGPFYWRWPIRYQEYIRDGVAFPFLRSPPLHMNPQKGIVDDHRKQIVVDKLSKVLDRRYLGSGTVKSLTSFFDVPKGKDDVRMVYDGTINGFNDSIEVPRFGLPTISSHLRSMMPSYFMVDGDVGECFLNFYLHHSLQPYVGVDLSKYVPLQHSKYHWVRWHRAGMGLKSSPYQACQAMWIVEEVIKGDPSDEDNPFRWDEAVTNLPGSDDYDPSKPWIFKLRKNDGCLACDVFIYVDDLRVTGCTRLEAWKACRKVCSTLNHLGIQDAARKRRDSSQTAGAWAGSVVYTTSEDVVVLVTTEKWNKGKSQLSEMSALVNNNLVSRKRLQEVRGFLNYIANTYPIIKSYLMGFHLTIDGWRKDRNKEGWKNLQYEFEECISLENDSAYVQEGPEYVEVKPRLITDIRSLQTLMNRESPPLRRIRSSKVNNVFYGFGDASGSAFGSTLSNGSKLFFEYGQWCSSESEQSSNWRELNNLLASLETWIKTQDLKGTQVFIFTDNSTAESAFWKGTSKSKLLCDLILRLKCLSLWHNIDLYIIHVSGRRMIEQGTDGLSRGDQSKGVMKGLPMRIFIPLHLTPTQRCPQMRIWINQLVEGWNFEWLTNAEWFEEHHREGNFIWDVAPAMGDLAYEMIDKARMKRPHTMHLVIVPRLFTGLWRRLMTRRTDCYIRIDWSQVWSLDTHFEPVLLFICIPFHVNRNFEFRRNTLLERFQGCLQECKMSKSSGVQQRNILRKFLQLARKIPSL